jgi:hypothetical protein
MTIPPRFGQQHLLRNLLAACPTFQTEVGVTSGTDAQKKTAAKLKVHRFEAIEEYHSGSRGIIRIAQHRIEDRGHGSWRDSSQLILTIDLVRDLPDETATGLAEREDEVLNTFGTIINEMIERQGQGIDETIDGEDQTYIRVVSFDLLQYDLINTSELTPADPTDDVDPDVPEQQILWYGRWEVRSQ